MRAILMYHSIDPSGSPISISADAFAAHVRWLASGRVRVAPLAAVRAAADGEDVVALTFDDGFANFAEHGWPRLEEAGLAATLFVVSDHAGRTNAWAGAGVRGAGIPELPLLDWDAVARLAARGVQIGAHTRTHPDLTRVSDAQLEDEVAGGAAAIAGRLGARPEAFAYPYGACDDRVVTAARRAYTLACTTELAPLERGADPHRLPRLDAYYFRDAGQLEAWGTAAFRRRLAFRALARRARAAVRVRRS